MNMFTNIFEEEAGLLRLILAVAAAAATAVGITVLIGLETSFQEMVPLAHVGGYLSLQVWIFFVSLWGMLGGGLGIVAGAFSSRSTALLKGLAAGVSPLLLVWLLTPRDPGAGFYNEPHPPGLVAFALHILLPALPGGVSALIMSGGQRGTA